MGDDGTNVENRGGWPISDVYNWVAVMPGNAMPSPFRRRALTASDACDPFVTRDSKPMSLADCIAARRAGLGTPVLGGRAGSELNCCLVGGGGGCCDCCRRSDVLCWWGGGGCCFRCCWRAVPTLLRCSDSPNSAESSCSFIIARLPGCVMNGTCAPFVATGSMLSSTVVASAVGY
ncbi:hypothetical protein CAOG_009351 [Capsaspora owczarzaki ATCC 30864]|uniref:Uncharacterized protein n=1 Tax=Capsaspora owczarzaki (strain ATCC 30864) TaxID=595528 RepID=A0A0D2WI12_CAPO3|nr:hypothetical protein CAOG_009351 [Capsaspora owczarzaki ATCC 30864]